MWRGRSRPRAGQNDTAVARNHLCSPQVKDFDREAREGKAAKFAEKFKSNYY